MAVIVVLNGLVGIISVNRVGQAADVILEEAYPIALASERLGGALEAQQRALRGYLLGEAAAAADFEAAVSDFLVWGRPGRGRP